MKNYSKLENHFKKIDSLDHLISMAGWDEAVMMPEGGGEARAEAMSGASALKHQLLTDPNVKDLIAGAKQEPLDDWQKSNLREIEREFILSAGVSEELIEKLTRQSFLVQQKWRTLRAENNWKDFCTPFEELVNLSIEHAHQLGDALNLKPYDALIGMYDPGYSQEKIDKVFAPLKEFLPSLIQEVLEKQKTEGFLPPKGSYPDELQKAAGLELMKAVGFDFNHGRLDVSHHPFCGGVPRDVRLTTAYEKEDFTHSIMGVLHETGHASYEQGLPTKWLAQPVGKARGMSIHEGQSLLFEMQMSRSPSFLKFALPILQKHLGECGDSIEFWSFENMRKLYEKVEPGYIRVKADEVTYPAHVLLRYEAEKQLISKSMKVSDLPEFWDQKMQELLGLSTKDNYKDGCMQDVHWPSGAFGYFPSYTLGAMTAAQLFSVCKQQNSGLMENIERGSFSELTNWLKDKVWSKGSSLSSTDLMIQATGEELNPKYFEQHLRYRYLA